METFSITTRSGKILTVETDGDDQKAAEFILSNKNSSDFARDIARKADNLSPKQRIWLHILAEQIRNPNTTSSDNFINTLGMLTKAGNVGKRLPKIRLRVDGFPVVIYKKKKGVAYVTDGGPFGNNRYYGSIHLDGSFRPSNSITENILNTLRALEANPAAVSSQHGIATGNCSFCGKDLTTAESRYVGYGPICAENFGLPWGDVSEEFHINGKKVFINEN